jgi:hypothetical protein
MSDVPSILILSACTATKVAKGRGPAMPAEELYTGQQHRRLMSGVHVYRAAEEPAGPLDLQILSARHGVISASECVNSYDATFSGLSQRQLLQRGAQLNVPEVVAGLLREPRRLAILLLGNNYLRAAQLPSAVELGAPTLVFTSPNAADRLPAVLGLHPIALSNRDAKSFSCGLVGLKGELAGRLLSRLARNPRARPPLEPTRLLAWLASHTEPHSVRSLRQDLAEAA